jgi:hypothetical protein
VPITDAKTPIVADITREHLLTGDQMSRIPPTQQELLYFILQNNEADHIPLTMAEIQNTLSIRRNETQGTLNPYAQGHFDSFNFIFKSLINSDDFPCKDSSILVNQYHSSSVLFWLRELHTLLMYPIATSSLSMDTNIKTYQCGTYRVYPKNLAFTQAPMPEQIEPLLHCWLVDIASFHDSIKTKVDNPYGLTKEESDLVFAKSLEANYFFSCLQPFEDGNNRLARIIENALRVKWYLPWKSCSQQEHQRFITKMSDYQTRGFKEWLKKI